MAKELQQTEEACSEKEPKQQKPKLAIAEQITHLKSKGVKFAICDEEEATSFLADVCDFYEATPTGSCSPSAKVGSTTGST